VTAQRLSALDAAFLEIEEADDCSHMHVGWAMLFDGAAPDVMALRRKLGERIGGVPRFNHRLSSPHTGGLLWPSWEDDTMFDLGAHVRHATLPAPGGEAELLDWLGDFYSHRLDRTRPLWEMTLLDGLAGGGWAIVTKVHHCMIDGVSGAELTTLMLDSTLSGRPAARPPAAPPARSRAIGAARAMLHPRTLVEMLDRSRALADLVRQELAPAADSSINVPIGATRRLAAVDASLADVKAIKRALGGTVNDVVLAASAGGLRRLLRSRGEVPARRGLRAMVPVNVRRAGEGQALGNRVSSLFVELPVAEPDPLRRYRLTASAARTLKERGQAAGTETVLDLAGLAPPVLHAAVTRLMFTPRLFNLTITNVRGSPTPLYAFGTRLRRIVPLVPIFANHAVGIAVASYTNQIVFGLNADERAMTDVDLLADGIAESVAELRRLARRQSRPQRASAPAKALSGP
jgi:diacylglycerol O-acyltransferase / wax synthase